MRLILYAQQHIPFGEITVRLVKGDPTVLVAAKQSIRFDRPEEFPNPEGEEEVEP